MTDWGLACVGALWLGILTSLSPCPLTTNIVAISYIGRRVDSPRAVLAAGLLYALGRTLVYVSVAALLVAGALSMTAVANFLQTHMNRVLGPVLILAGMFLLGLLSLNLPGRGLSEGTQRRVASWGIWGAGALGILFALSFCPVSAALYFGGLIPLSLNYSSRLLLPLLYGIGTALPVLAVAFLVSAGARRLADDYNRLKAFERWSRRVTGALFIAAGVYFTLAYTFGLPI